MNTAPAVHRRFFGRPAWVPYEGTHCTIRAGVWWDAIRMPRGTGSHALEALEQHLGLLPGPVITDPHGPQPRMYFLVPTTTADHWDIPGTQALGTASYIVVPDVSRTEPPGLHWTVPPDGDHQLTSPHALREALDSVPLPLGRPG